MIDINSIVGKTIKKVTIPEELGSIKFAFEDDTAITFSREGTLIESELIEIILFPSSEKNNVKS